MHTNCSYSSRSASCSWRSRSNACCRSLERSSAICKNSVATYAQVECGGTYVNLFLQSLFFLKRKSLNPLQWNQDDVLDCDDPRFAEHLVEVAIVVAHFRQLVPLNVDHDFQSIQIPRVWKGCFVQFDLFFQMLDIVLQIFDLQIEFLQRPIFKFHFACFVLLGNISAMKKHNDSKGSYSN